MPDDERGGRPLSIVLLALLIGLAIYQVVVLVTHLNEPISPL